MIRHNLETNQSDPKYWCCCLSQSFWPQMWVDYTFKFLVTNASGWHSLRSAGWSWSLELEWCERKTLLPGWWLEASTGAMWERNIVRLEAAAPAEHGDFLSTRPFCAFSLINLYNHLGFRIKQWVLFFKEMDHFSVKYFLVKTFESYGCPCLF